MSLTDEQKAAIRRAVHDPGAVVGKRHGPSWTLGNDGYAEEQESLWLWVVRAVTATVETELAKANGSTDRIKSRLEKAESELADAKLEATRVWSLLHDARQRMRRLTTILIANASRLDVQFTNAEGSPWTLHVKPALESLQTALGMRGAWPSSSGTTGATDTAPRPTVVCLCGSTRFSHAFREANLRETLAGRIVLSIGCDMRSDAELFTDLDETTIAKVKTDLDELHKRKIDLADEVLVLNVGGYVGDSTRSEIAYAEHLGKPIRWLEEVDRG